MVDLDASEQAENQRTFFAPVELKGLTECKRQWLMRYLVRAYNVKPHRSKPDAGIEMTPLNPDLPGRLRTSD